MKMKKYFIIFSFFLFVNLAFVLSCSVIDVNSSAASQPQATLNGDAVVCISDAIKEKELKTIERKSEVRLYFPDTDEIKTLELEEYIIGVLTGEMYSDVHEEALKAVAVAARSYALYMCEQNKNKDYDLVASPNVSQAYISKEMAIDAWSEAGEQKYDEMTRAVVATRGEVMTYNDKIICALYHASSYPKTENNENVFVEALPYLVGAESVEDINEAYRSQVVYSYDEFNNRLSDNGFPQVDFSLLKIENIKNENERCSFLAIKDDEVGYTIDGRKIRQLFSLNSTSFDLDVENGSVVFTVYGFGHGVGLSQNGAKILAKEGKNYEYILKKYYKGAELSKTIYI